MRIVVLGLSITSSWGNGHATTYRALLRELDHSGHDVLFLERDQPWYAQNRDLPRPNFCEARIYRSIAELKRMFGGEIRHADCVMIGSYVPEGRLILEWLSSATSGRTAFYDIDTPVTLTQLAIDRCDYISAKQIPKLDVYLSFTGGPTLTAIRRLYGARRAYALYCSVDPNQYFPEPARKQWVLGYLGTFSADRQPMLKRLLINVARQLPTHQFIVAGPQYPKSLRWPKNIRRVQHLQPAAHRRFYNAQRFTLNITRRAMVRAGWSPSVRLFEAAACATPIISDYWPGIDQFFQPETEILTARSSNEVFRALREVPLNEAAAIGYRARARVLAEHTAAHRAAELIEIFDAIAAGKNVATARFEEAAA